MITIGEVAFQMKSVFYILSIVYLQQYKQVDINMFRYMSNIFHIYIS